jgi:hypothetical protein
MIKRLRCKLEIEMELQGKYCTVTAQASGYSDPGSCYGPVETSYPPEAECELYDIEIRDTNTGSLLTVANAEEDRVNEALEEAFWEAYDN